MQKPKLEPKPKPESNDIGEATLKEKNGISAIWLLPFVALLIGVWLVVKGVVNAPVDVTIQFKDGTGIVPGKTAVIYDGITVGSVASMALLPAGGVEVIAELDKSSAYLLADETKVWLVKPELSLAGVSGLDTIISGNYITLIPGKGNPKFNFKALSEKPPLDYSYPGLHISLETRDLASVQEGSPIYYHRIQVGMVDTFKLLDDAETIKIDLHVEPEYAHLVKKNTKFWNASGLEVTGGLGGFKINTQSLKSILVGGVSFSTDTADKSTLAVNGDTYKLYADEDLANDNGIAIKLLFSDGDGLVEGAEIKYKGIQVGTIEKVYLNSKMDGVIAEAKMASTASNLATKNSLFWVVSPKLGLADTKNLDTLISGHYISVLPGDSKARQFTFEGLLEAPTNLESKEEGLNIILTSSRLGSVKPGVNIFYRDIKVGEVTGFELAEASDQVLIKVTIQEQYQALVRENTVFWNASGIGVDFSLFSGAKIRTNSIESILEGGISFATPEEEPESEVTTEALKKPAVKNRVFELHDEVNDEWLEWAPSIPLNK